MLKCGPSSIFAVKNMNLYTRMQVSTALITVCQSWAGPQPSGRFSPGFAVCGGSAYLFGGYTGGGHKFALAFPARPFKFPDLIYRFFAVLTQFSWLQCICVSSSRMCSDCIPTKKTGPQRNAFLLTNHFPEFSQYTRTICIDSTSLRAAGAAWKALP